MIIKIDSHSWFVHNNKVFELPLFNTLNIPKQESEISSLYVLCPIKIDNQDYLDGPLLLDLNSIDKINKTWDFCITNSVRYIEVEI